MLTGGTTDLTLDAQTGEVVRFFLTNTANTRIFNVSIPGARMKLVGGDSGRYEREEWIDAVLLAPSERAVVDVLFAVARHLPDRASDPGHTPIGSARSLSPTSPPTARVSTSSRRCTPIPSSRSERARLEDERTATGRQDPRVHRIDAAPLRRTAPTRRRHTCARCIPTSPAANRAPARSAA